MAWFKIDDGLHSSRKFMSIPKRARWTAIGVWTLAGSWCADQLTDGHVPDYMLTEWGTPPAAPEALVGAGLWQRVDDGYVFHNWAEYQPRKEDVDAERAAARERMRELRARRKQDKPQESKEEAGLFGRTGANGSENVRNPDPTRPLKEETNVSSRPRKRATRIPNDFTVTEQMKSWHAENCPHVDGPRETVKFINYWSAKSGKDASKLDWAATWRNWMLTAAERTPNTAPSGELNVDAILGKDYWTPPKAPPGSTLEEEIQWKQDRRAEHERARVEEARRVMSRAS